jgi:hypothetical protein
MDIMRVGALSRNDNPESTVVLVGDHEREQADKRMVRILQKRVRVLRVHGASRED